MRTLSQRVNEAFNENKNDYHLIRAYLGELWFARHNGETTKYKELAKKLDGLKVPFAVQNEVADDASNTTKKAIDTLEVQDRIAKILKKHNINETLNEAKGIELDDDWDNIKDFEGAMSPKLKKLWDEFLDETGDGSDYETLKKWEKTFKPHKLTFDYGLDAVTHDFKLG